MKIILILVVLCMMSSCSTFKEFLSPSSTDEKLKGKQYSQVIDIMGNPQSEYSHGSYRILKYDNGNIILKNDIYILNHPYSENIIHAKVLSFDTNVKSGKKAYIASGMSDVSEGTAEFKDYSKLVGNLLKYKGLDIVSQPSLAEVIIFIRYGVSEPQVEYTQWSVPVYSFSLGNTERTNFHGNKGNYLGSATTTDNGGYSYMGQRSGTTKSVTFNRYFSIEAVNATALKDKKVDQYWKTAISSTGNTSNSKMIKHLMYFSSWYWNNPSEGDESVFFDYEDPRYKLVEAETKFN